MSGSSPNKTQRQIGEDLFARLAWAKVRYENAAHDERVLLDGAADTVGTADGNLFLAKASRVHVATTTALREYESALQACTKFILKH